MQVCCAGMAINAIAPARTSDSTSGSSGWRRYIGPAAPRGGLFDDAVALVGFACCLWARDGPGTTADAERAQRASPCARFNVAIRRLHTTSIVTDTMLDQRSLDCQNNRRTNDGTRLSRLAAASCTGYLVWLLLNPGAATGQPTGDADRDGLRPDSATGESTELRARLLRERRTGVRGPVRRRRSLRHRFAAMASRPSATRATRSSPSRAVRAANRGGRCLPRTSSISPKAS